MDYTLLALGVLGPDHSILHSDSRDTELRDIVLAEMKTVITDFKDDPRNESVVVTQQGQWVTRHKDITLVLLLPSTAPPRIVDSVEKSVRDILNMSPGWVSPDTAQALKSLLVGSSHKLDQASQSIELVKTNIQQGLSKMVDNHTELTHIQEQSDDLLQKATSFNRSSATLRRKMQRQQFYLRLALLGIFLLLLGYVYFMYFG